MKSLLIGCGRDHTKKVQYKGVAEWEGELIKMDMNPNCGADVVWDMEIKPLPFRDNEFSEVHAYNCLEHWGRQGDWRGWFDEMEEYWRILKPGGIFCAIVPVGEDSFADPGHTRFFSQNHFLFLNQKFYDHNEIKGTCFTDYRWYWKKNFDILHAESMDSHIAFILRKS